MSREELKKVTIEKLIKLSEQYEQELLELNTWYLLKIAGIILIGIIGLVWNKRVYDYNVQQKQSLMEITEKELVNRTFIDIVNNPEFDEQTYLKELVRLNPNKEYKEILMEQKSKFESLRTDYIELEGFQEEKFNQIIELINQLISNLS